MRVVALAFLCACGDNVVGIPFAEFDDASTAAQCERLVRCGVATDLESCTSFFRKRPDLDLARAIEANLVRYSGPAAEQCLAALASQSCDTSSKSARETPAACKDTFVGTLPDDEACAFDEECASGTCSIPSCMGRCCAGTCRPERQRARVDGPCELDIDCVPDTFCGTDAVCHALGGEGDLCASNNQCEYGSTCIGPTELMPGNCRKQPLLGESCLYMQCAELGAVCTAGVCVALGLPGAPCTGARDCSPLLHCATDVCAEIPVLGEACIGTGCAGEAWCDFEAQLCAVPKTNNEPCTANDQCESLFCEEGVVFDFCTERAACF